MAFLWYTILLLRIVFENIMDSHAYVLYVIVSTPHFSIIVIARLFRCRGDLDSEAVFSSTLRVSWIAASPLSATPR
jgi:hypothetical protein